MILKPNDWLVKEEPSMYTLYTYILKDEQYGFYRIGEKPFEATYLIPNKLFYFC